MLSHSTGQTERCRAYWTRAVDLGNELLPVTVADIVIDKSCPNLFDHGDGIREYCLAWDNIAKAANGLGLLFVEKSIAPSRLDDFLNLFSCKHQVLHKDLLRTGEVLRTRTVDVTDLTVRLLEAEQGIRDRTAELVGSRELLIERTRLLEEAQRELQDRTVGLTNRIRAWWSTLRF